jgi:hypothetical protein
MPDDSGDVEIQQYGAHWNAGFGHVEPDGDPQPLVLEVWYKLPGGSYDYRVGQLPGEPYAWRVGPGMVPAKPAWVQHLAEGGEPSDA